MSQGKLGHKVADIVVRRMLDAKRRHAPELVRLAMAIQEAFFTLTGTEHKATTGGLWRKLLDTGQLEGWTADTAHFLGHGHGQWQTLLAGQATGAAMGNGVGAIVGNELAPAVQAAIRANPHGLLAPGDLAQAVARHRLDLESAQDDAASAGISHSDFGVLVAMATQPPTIEQALDMRNRGLINDGTFFLIGNRNGLDADYLEHLLATREQPITPADLASLVTFGVLSENDAASMAALSGTTADNFHLLVEGNGQPPSNEELLFAYRRGIINKDRLLRGITQGPVRNEWFDVIESLGSVPMSTSDAIEASVQNHLTYDQAKAIAQQNGLMPDQFDPLYQAAGSPPGPQEVLEFLNRKWITEDQARQALNESRLKPKYTDLIIKSREKLLPMVQVREALGHGAITHDHAVEVLAEHGYTPEDIDVILQTAAATKTQGVKALTEAQVLSLHADLTISDTQAGDMLTALGYDSNEIGWLLGMSELKRKQAVVNAAISKIRSAFVGRHIDDGTASSDLDAIGVPPDQRDYLMELWTIEASTTTKTLTAAQCAAALKAGLITGDGFVSRLEALGYSAADAQILQSLATPAAQPGA